MASLNMTEAELAGNVHAALEKVRQGFEIVINQGDQPVAVIKTVEFPGRDIDECIALLRSRGSRRKLCSRRASGH